MQVKCQSYLEFLQCLESLRPGTEDLYEGTIRVSPSLIPKGDASRTVVLQLSTIVVKQEGGEYLLVGSENCGVDYTDSGGQFDGTRRADQVRAELSEFCKKKGWRILPGIIEI